MRADSRWSSGSSPLTRGKPSRGASLRGRTGLIPAHAGKTAVMTCCRDARRAHPRSRGENCSRAYSHGSGRGSSPLTRGKRCLPGHPDHWPGLIPAHAGKTGVPAWTPGARPAHPRSRGENTPRGGRTRGVAGSSPLTRGKHRIPSLSHVQTGLIPAHAGKTWVGRWVALRGWAHPRSRGENVSMTARVMTNPGSSPLTRGKPRLGVRAAYGVGLIPAHAGKTNYFDHSHGLFRAHPRSRGENWRSRPRRRGW